MNRPIVKDDEAVQQSLARKLEKTLAELKDKTNAYKATQEELLKANTRLDREIADRKRTEKILRLSQESASKSYRAAKITYWEWSKHDGMISHRPDAYALTADGYYEEPVSSYEDFFAGLHEDDRDRVRKYYDYVDAEEVDLEIEYRILNHKGEVRYIHELSTAVFDDDGQFTGHVGTHQDVSDPKERELALSRSEARYREIFEESPVAIWEDDWSSVKRMIDGIVASGITDLRRYFNENLTKLREAYRLIKPIDISRATRDLFGAPDSQSLIDWVHAGTVPDLFLDDILAFRAGKMEFEYEAQQNRLDGKSISTLSRVVIPPLYRHDWSRVFYAIEDITERKRTEAALIESEARLLDAIESFPGGFILYNDDHTMILCNKQFQNFYPSLADILVPGVSFEELCRVAFNSGAIQDWA